MLPMPQIILSAVSVSPTLIWCIIGIAVFLLLCTLTNLFQFRFSSLFLLLGLHILLLRCPVCARRKRYSSDARDSVCRSSSG